MNLGKESETVEHKRSTSELREGMESAASILNKHGRGTLYFGVRPSDGEVVGQDVSEKTLRDVSQAFANRIEPRVYPTVEHLVTADGKSYIRAAFSGDERPYVCDGRYRIRNADEDLPMSAAALAGMMLERAARRDPWDGRPSGRSLSEVDEETLRAYVERGVERRRIPFGYTDTRDVLARLGLPCDDGCLTNAAAACFCPSKNVMLRMGVLADSERVHILDNRQETGTLFQLVEAAELYILNNIRRAFVIDGSSLQGGGAGNPAQRDPRGAIQRVLPPALRGRRGDADRHILGRRGHLQPRFLPRRVRAGGLPVRRGDGLQAAQPADRSHPLPLRRHRDLRHGAEAHQGRMRRAGRARGSIRVCRQCARTVHARGGRRGGDPATGSPLRDGASDATESRKTAVLRRARERGGITTAKAAELLDVKDYTARRILNAMADDGFLEKTGGRRGRVYKPAQGSY